MNAIFYWRLAQLLLGGIIVEKPKNPLWRILSYFDNRISTPKEQPFLPFAILTLYFFSDLSLLTFSYILLYCYYFDVEIFDDTMEFFCNKPVNKIRHYVLSNSLAWLRVNLVLGQLFNQTLCASYFTELISGSFGNVPVNKIRHYVLDILLYFLWNHSITNRWIKSDTMCYLVLWFD